MRLSRRPAAADPALVERVGRLLARPSPSGGWVPPQQPGDSWPADDHGWPSDEDGGPDDGGPAREGAGRGPVELERSWASPAAGGPAGPRGLLPATLAGGRLDPGQRGAVALLLVCVLAALVAAGVVLRGRPQEVEVPVLQQAGTTLPGAPTPTPAPTSPAELVVAVVGEVAAPGVVRVPAGSRVEDALRAAGGLAPGGSAGLMNLARPLVDGEQVVVGPDAPPDPAVGGGAGAAGGTGGGLVDLNRATAADLETLPGIGPVLAERVVAWRTENGGFASVDQLREVPGIGEAKYAALKTEVTV